MAIFYKPFRFFRIVPRVYFLALMGFSLFLATLVPVSSHAMGSLFTVDDIAVDVSAENAIKAREKAFEQAQAQAFDVLLQRMLSEADMQNFQKPSPQNISTLIQDFEVRNEKLSSKRYSATYKFRFKDKDVRRYFSGRGAAYTDVVRKPILILPFIETSNGTALWSPTNQWMRAWNNAGNLDGLVPLIVPIGDLEDVSDIGDDEALTYDVRRLSSMLRRYRASEAVVALARPLEAGGLEVQMYRTDRQRPEYVHQIVQPAVGDDMFVAYSSAVSKVRGALQRQWKTRTAIQPDQPQGQMTQVRVEFESLAEWAQIQNALRQVPGLSETRLKALSPKDAYLELVYQGGIDRLRLALAQVDMQLSPRPVVAGGGHVPRFGRNVTPVYDLTFGVRGYGAAINPAAAGRSVSPQSDAYRAQF